MRPGMRSFHAIPVTVLLLLASAMAWTAPAHAFVAEGQPWAQGRIPYYDSTPYRPQVAAAVRAWNTSGARVRFVAVPRRSAKVIIRVGSGATFCSRGYASIGRTMRGFVDLPIASPGCGGRNPHVVTLIAAHELGHVLGLGHEDRRCAVMNASMSSTRPARCPSQARWQWRCRILERDDVAGAVRRYGGTIAPRPPELCDAYAAAPPPTMLTTPAPQGYSIATRIRWNGGATIPTWLSEGRTPLPGSFVGYEWAAGDTCVPVTVTSSMKALSQDPLDRKSVV